LLAPLRRTRHLSITSNVPFSSTPFSSTNNNSRHFSFNADELFLPIYQHADEDNAKITHLEIFAEKFLASAR